MKSLCVCGNNKVLAVACDAAGPYVSNIHPSCSYVFQKSVQYGLSGLQAFKACDNSRVFKLRWWTWSKCLSISSVLQTIKRFLILLF